MQKRVIMSKIEAWLARLSLPILVFLFVVGLFGLIVYGTYCLIPVHLDAYSLFFIVPVERVLIGLLSLISGFVFIHCSFARLRLQSRKTLKLPCE